MSAHLIPIAALVFAAAVPAQTWLSWNDETPSRLQFNTVPNGGSGVSLSDSDEKDMITDDFDHDGDEDVCIVRKVPFSVAGARSNVLLMNENGVLVDRTATLAPDMLTADDTRDVLVVDINNDTWVDLVTATTFGESPTVWVNQGESSGVWQGFAAEPSRIPAFPQGPMFCAVYEGDVNHDGWMDLYFSDYDSTLEDQLLINDGTGFFINGTATHIAAGLNNSVFGTGSFVCDFTGDGWDDILKVSGEFEPMKLLINDGAGFFGVSQQLTLTGFGGDSVYMARVGDYDVDGRMDVYVIDDGDDFVLYNDSTNPDGTINTTRFTLGFSPRTDGIGGNVKAADLDRDGCRDVGVCDVDVDDPNCASGSRFAVIRNDFARTGSRSFMEPDALFVLPWNTAGTHDIEFFDINGDGFLDILVATCATYHVFIQDPFAVSEPYGDACLGTVGLPQIGTLGGAPTVGNSSFKITLGNVPVGAPTALLVGFGRAQIPFLGCDILVDPLSLFSIPTGTANAMGGVQLAAPIPNDPMQEGGSLNCQFITIDIGATLNGEGSLSDALAIYVSSNFVL